MFPYTEIIQYNLIIQSLLLNRNFSLRQKDFQLSFQLKTIYLVELRKYSIINKQKHILVKVPPNSI